MDVHSTLTVSRGAALEKLMNIPWQMLPNDCIEELLGVLFDHELYNFVVLNGQYARDDNAVLERLNIRIHERDHEHT